MGEAVCYDVVMGVTPALQILKDFDITLVYEPGSDRF